MELFKKKFPEPDFPNGKGPTSAQYSGLKIFPLRHTAMKYPNSWEKDPRTFQSVGEWVGARHKRCGIKIASDFSMRCPGNQKIVEKLKFLRKIISIP